MAGTARRKGDAAQPQPGSTRRTRQGPGSWRSKGRPQLAWAGGSRRLGLRSGPVPPPGFARRRQPAPEQQRSAPARLGRDKASGPRRALVTGAQRCIAPRSGQSRGIAESSLHASAIEGPRPRDRLGEEQARHSFALSCFPFQLSIPPPPPPSTLSSSRSLSRADSLPAVLANKGLGTRALHAESCWRRLRRRRCRAGR